MRTTTFFGESVGDRALEDRTTPQAPQPGTIAEWIKLRKEWDAHVRYINTPAVMRDERDMKAHFDRLLEQRDVIRESNAFFGEVVGDRARDTKPEPRVSRVNEHIKEWLLARKEWRAEVRNRTRFVVPQEHPKVIAPALDAFEDQPTHDLQSWDWWTSAIPHRVNPDARINTWSTKTTPGTWIDPVKFAEPYPALRPAPTRIPGPGVARAPSPFGAFEFMLVFTIIALIMFGAVALLASW